MSEQTDSNALFAQLESQMTHSPQTPERPFGSGLHWGRGESPNPDQAMQQAVEALERSVHETIRARCHNSWPDYAAPSHTLNLVHGPSGSPVFIVTVMAHVRFWKHGG